MGLFFEVFNGSYLAADGDRALTSSEVRQHGMVVVTGVDSTVTLPAPGEGVRGHCLVVAHAGSGGCTVACPGGFLGGGSGISVVAGQCVLVMCQKTGVGAYSWMAVASSGDAGAFCGTPGLDRGWEVFSPVVCWGGQEPTVTAIARFRQLGGSVFFVLDLSASDGCGADFVSASLPVTPRQVGAYVPVQGVCVVDGVFAAAVAEIDAVDAAESNRVVMARSVVNWKSGRPCRLSLSGHYEV